MARATQILTNFASGELDPTLRGQKDLDAYHAGAKRCRNVQRRSSGGMERRPGTYDLASLIGQARLEEFQFAADQRYLVAFSNARVDIYDVNGTLLDTVTAMWWDATTMWEMSTTQLGDVMVITHQAFPPQRLLRDGPTSFSVSDFVFDTAVGGTKTYQPYFKFAAPDVTVTAHDTGSGVTLTASSAVFTSDYATEQIRLRVYGVECRCTAYTSPTVITVTFAGIPLEAKLDLDPFKTTKGSNDVEVTHLFHGLATGATVTFSGCNATGSIPASYFNGSHTITVVDEHHYKITLSGVSYNYWEDDNQDGTPTSVAYTAARLSEDGGGPNVKLSGYDLATRQWEEQAFSIPRGWPAACAFHEGRLWFGGSTSQPDGAWGSSALQYYRFDTGKGYDGDSVQVATGSEDVSDTRHLISNGELIVMNANAESAFMIRDGEAITPNNARIKGQSTIGSSTMQPCRFDSAVLFTQDNGLGAYELAYSAQTDSHQAVAISTLASHLVRTPRAVAASPGTTSRAEQMAFWANLDGTLAVFHSQRRENIAGWVLWELGAGLVESVATVGPYVFLCVFVRGARRLYRVADLDLVSLDGAVAHQAVGPATVDWTLDARVRNRTVHLVSELGYHGTYDVPADGTVTLETAVTELVAGDAFYATIETLPPSVALGTGPRDGMIKRVVRTITDFGDDSLAATVDGFAIDTIPNDADWTGAVRPVTSPYEMHHLGCERDPTVTLSQSAPLAPWRVLSVLQEVNL